MSLFEIGLGILLGSAALTFLIKNPWLRKALSCAGVFAGSSLGFAGSVLALVHGTNTVITLGSPLPSLTLALGVDMLSAFFLVAIFGLSLLIGLYAWGYLQGQPQLLASLPFFPLLVAFMALVVMARDGFFFLIAWEIMSLASFFLVTAEDEHREARQAGWIYLIATHLATAFLMAFFVLLSQVHGSLSFEAFASVGSFPPFLANVLFLFMLVGFGTKAGIFPFHVWLPRAHPAAPSYISALMSGAMIKTGIYGILRALTFLPAAPLWWGETLIALGILSALLGILYALPQQDIKRLLAYSSVENIGIIVAGIGLGVIGQSLHSPLIQVLGFAGALLHVWNHAIFKGLLFLGAGSIVRATHTRNLERMGGLIKRMPVTGAAFFMGAAAICGLPPLNGFVSEWLLYLGLFRGARSLSGPPLLWATAALVAIAAAGALAIACFGKVFGVMFLGNPRAEELRQSRQATLWEKFPMAVLASLCMTMGIAFPRLWTMLQSMVTGNTISTDSASDEIVRALTSVSNISAAFLALILIGWLLRSLSLRRRAKRQTVTWDCGYASPSARMQYTGSSFVEPLVAFFKPVLKPQERLDLQQEYFPPQGRWDEHVEDLAERSFLRPLVERISKLFSFLRSFQGVRVQYYLALIFVALIGLLLWEVFVGI